MLHVLKTSWALLLGMLLLLLGNGLQGTLLGIRGSIEGYDAETMAFVMSGYYLGFLLGSRRATPMIARVGHVRVFAALASTISAAFILYAAAPEAWVWTLMRFVVGFSFAGVYVVAESWLNDAATNETRGQALSLYMIVQMVGIISAQFILTLADPARLHPVRRDVGAGLGQLPADPADRRRPRPPSRRRSRCRSPSSSASRRSAASGTFMLGGVYAGIFAMGSVFGTAKGLTVAQISTFVAAIYTGGLVFQYPIGWLSDRMDRRRLILFLTAGGAVLTLLGALVSERYLAILVLGFVIGGVANPLYALIIAYTNDFLEPQDMPAASGGLLFINGLGAITGPFLIGVMMTRFGPDAYFAYIGGLFALIALYAGYRMTRRSAPPSSEPYAPVLPQASPVALEVAQEVAIERASEAAGRA